MKKNVTLSADSLLIEKARAAARRRGKTLNQLFREYLAWLTAAKGRGDWSTEFRALVDQGRGHSRGKKVRREDLYDRPVLRRH